MRVPTELLCEICDRNNWSVVHFYGALIELELRGAIRFTPPAGTSPDVVATSGVAALRESLGGATLEEMLDAPSSAEATPEEATEAMRGLRGLLDGATLDDLAPEGDDG